MSQISTSRADLLLVTVTDSETDAVGSILSERYDRSPQTVIVGNRPYADLGSLGGARTFLVRSEMGAGGGGGSLLTIDTAIRNLSPRAVIMLGVAFGLKPEMHHIGDVLVASKLMLYDLQRIGTASDGSYVVRPRGERVAPSAALLGRCHAGRDSWRSAPVRVGLILSGEKLVDHINFREQLRQLEPEAIGGEMEGAGLYAAAQHHKIDWILVKAITDWADGKKGLGEEGHQELAARNAAAFVLHVIEQGGWAGELEQATLAPGATTRLEELSLSQLRQLLSESMSVGELQTLCFDLGVNPEELPGEGKAALVRELLGYLQRRRRLPELYIWLRKHRSDILS